MTTRSRTIRNSSAIIATVVLAGCILPRWPVDGPITSPFGVRLRGTLPEIHRGVDLSVPTGTEVLAMASATVRFASTMTGYGRVVWLDHGGDVLSVYAHLSEIRVAPGQAIRKGAVIGLSGETGNATAPHLHFEVWRWGWEVDPVAVFGGLP